MIRFENVSVFYNKKKALDNINITLPHKSLSVVGVNGCGKTTFLKCLAGIVEFDGNIYINNVNIKNFKRKPFAKKVGMLSQISYINFDYTVFDTVMMGRYAYQDTFYNNKNEDEKIVLEAINTVGLIDYKDIYISNLSGGQMQRVLLAKLISQNPDVVLLDEPTNHLDFKYQLELINFLKNWSNENNKTIIGVLHDINLAMLLSDNMLILDEGKVKACDNIKNIISNNILNDIYKVDIKKYMLQTLEKWGNF